MDLKTVTYRKISPKMVKPRDIGGNAEEGEEPSAVKAGASMPSNKTLPWKRSGKMSALGVADLGSSLAFPEVLVQVNKTLPWKRSGKMSALGVADLGSSLAFPEVLVQVQTCQRLQCLPVQAL